MAPPAAKASEASTTGLVLDCGSGHASIFWYETKEGSVKQRRRSRLSYNDAQYKLAEELIDDDGLPERIQLAIGALRSEINLVAALGEIAPPTLLFVGATGGVREALADGRMTSQAVNEFSRAIEGAFIATIPHVRVTVLTGEQEATWELGAARAIWGARGAIMFDDAPDAARFGLFSGGGQSMQIGMEGVVRSFPFSTWSVHMDEKKGAHFEAWRDPAIWSAWEEALIAAIEEEKARLDKPLRGCFVLSAMNERAAEAAGFSQTPITAAQAITRLRTTLGAFIAGTGDAFHTYLDERKHYKYNVARVTAMHLSRLAHVLEAIFEPDARVYAPGRSDVHCEWAVGAFVDEVGRVSAEAAA